MAEEIQPTEALNTETPANVAPNLDSELDAALGGAFFKETTQQASNEEKPVQAQPKEESKPSKIESKAEEKSSKKDVSKQPLQNPDEIPESPHGKPSDAWKSLKSQYRQSREEAAQKEKEISKLKESLAEKGNSTSKEVEELRTKIQSLSKYQAIEDLRADPEFIAKFDGPLNEKIQSLQSIMKEWNISDDIIKNIDFSNKSTLGTIAKVIRANMASIESEFSVEEFMANARDVIELGKKKNAALEEHGKNYKQIVEEKKKEAFARSAENEGKALKYVQDIIGKKDVNNNPVIPFLNKITPKENATAAEINQINEHNTFVDQMYEKIDSELRTNDPERKAKLIIAAAASNYLSAKVKTLTDKLKSVEGELSKISKINSEDDKTKVRGANRNNGGNQETDLDSALSVHSWSK